MNYDISLCPFCKSDWAEVRVHWVQTNQHYEREIIKYYHVECCSCCARGPSCNTEEGAIALWNKRLG